MKENLKKKKKTQKEARRENKGDKEGRFQDRGLRGRDKDQVDGWGHGTGGDNSKPVSEQTAQSATELNSHRTWCDNLWVRQTTDQWYSESPSHCSIPKLCGKLCCGPGLEWTKDESRSYAPS